MKGEDRRKERDSSARALAAGAKTLRLSRLPSGAKSLRTRRCALREGDRRSQSKVWVGTVQLWSGFRSYEMVSRTRDTFVSLVRMPT